MLRPRSIAPLFVFAFAAAGCGGGEGPFTPAIAIAGYADPSVPIDLAPADIRLAIEEIVAVACDGARFPTRRRVHAELVRGEVATDEELAIPPGSYCGIEVVLSGCTEPERCPAITPDAIAVIGVRRSDGARVEARDESPIDVSLLGRFALDPDDGGVILVVDHATLLGGLEVATLPLEADGTGRIDGARNADRLPALREGLRAALTLRRDRNGNRRLDPGEVEGEPLAAAVAPP